MGTVKLSAHTSVFEELFQLPDGYAIAGVEYDPAQKLINFLLTSDALPDGCEQQALLIMHTEYLAGHPEYRKFAGEVRFL